MLNILSLLALTATLTTAIPVLPRAGGPSIVPIPDSCNLMDVSPVLPSTAAAYTSDSANETFVPSSSTLLNARLYAWFITTQDNDGSKDYKTCLEQCYGFGNGTQCGGVYFAQNYPSEAQHGAPGGVPSNACLMFDRPLTAADFDVVKGTEVNATGTNIVCPPKGQ